MANKKSQSEELKKTDGLNKIYQKVFSHQLIKKTVIILVMIIAVILGIYLIFNLIYAQVIFPHTYIGSIDLSNKTMAQAKDLLGQSISSAQNRTLNLEYQDKSVKISQTDLDVNYDLQKTLDLAWSVGRKGSLQKVLIEQFRSVFAFNRYPAVFTYNSAALQSQIADMAKKIDQPEQDATIEIKDMSPKVVSEQNGLAVDQTKSQKDVLASFGELDQNPKIELTIHQIMPKVTTLNTDQAVAQTNQILAQDITLKTDKQDFILKKADIAGFLSFASVKTGLAQNWTLAVQINNDAVTKYVTNLAKNIDQDPKDAKFAVTDGKVSTFQLSQTGYALDQTNAVKTISSAILNSSAEVTLSVKIVKPAVSDSASTDGIKEIIGEATTTWTGSPNNRIHNLTLGTQKISGSIIEPGAEFSTVKTIGEIDASTGFLQELVIKNGTQVAPEYGGGLCQVSTTLFRAVLNAGLKITQRTPHSFRVSYYEPPVGMDATIYDPSPDFRFVNDTKYPILIWAVATSNGLDFQIYGTKDGRVSSVSQPSVGNYIDPPDAIYTESDTLDQGAIRQVERATRGCTASFDYLVTAKDGSTLEKQTFVSKYMPVPATFWYGPGTTIPPA